MKQRRSFVLAGVLLIAACSLSACGFKAATDRPYTQAAGANDVSGDIDVLNAVIVAPEDGSGAFIASLSNNTDDETVSFESLAAGTDGVIVPGDVQAVEIAPHALVNLATTGGVPVTGDFKQGDFVDVVLSFDSGQQTAIEVPVVPATGAFEGLGSSSASPSETATP